MTKFKFEFDEAKVIKKETTKTVGKINPYNGCRVREINAFIYRAMSYIQKLMVAIKIEKVKVIKKLSQRSHVLSKVPVIQLKPCHLLNTLQLKKIFISVSHMCLCL